MKEKNKSLLITSLISVSMSVIAFSSMAADKSMEHGNKLESTITTVNQERNTIYPKTDNTKALYTSDTDQSYRVKEYNESFIFKDVNGNTINIDDSVKVPTFNSAAGYNLYNNTVSDTGFISGHKEVEDAGYGSYKGRFFRYWNPTAHSIDDYNKTYDSDGQYSPSFPKLCYKLNNAYPSATYPTEKMNNKGEFTNPLIRLASVGGNENSDKKMRYDSNHHNLFIPVVRAEPQEIINAGFKGYVLADQKNTLTPVDGLFNGKDLNCNTQENKCTLTWTGSCLKISPYGAFKTLNPDNITGYDYIGKTNLRYSDIVNCSSKSKKTLCGEYDVKSFTDNNSDEAYRISQFVKIDIAGNTDPIELPQQTCFKCLNVQTSGVEDTSCSYIVNEVFKAKKGDCAATVAALATNPRLVKDYLPASLNNEYNCKSCLCKIESLLKAKGCN